MVRVRRDIWSLEGQQAWHPITRAYALAVEEMKTRDAALASSWTYQAQIHGMPGFVQPDQFRGQCQHDGWFFLSWHRLYLYWFEQTVLAAVRAHDRIDDEVKASWALPYWNYSKSRQQARLPEAFCQKAHPDDPNRPNPLLAKRNDYINDGDPLPEEVTLLTALDEPVFSLPRPLGGFGGAATGFNHLHNDPARFLGKLEQTPHNDVHNEVGGDMLGFSTAGLDPVFWMHHANIDRLWVVWIGQPGRKNPDATGRWGTTIAHFHDPDGADVEGKAARALDTVADLSYEYEDTSLPAPDRRARTLRVPSEPPPDHPAELVGATEDAFELTGRTKRVALSLGRPTGPARRRGGAAPERVYLTVEGIEGEVNPGVTYAVYVNLAEEDVDEPPDTHYAGNVSFFGIEGTRQVDADPGGAGLARSYDITSIVSQLRDEDSWNPDEVAVTFVPLRRGGSERRRGASERETPPVRLGRVGVYYQ